MIAAFLLRYWPTILAALVVGGAVWWVSSLLRTVDSLRAESDALRGSLAGCNARVDDITKDRKSDATVTDPGAFDVPDGWLLPAQP
jgi:hypothetical protein